MDSVPITEVDPERRQEYVSSLATGVQVPALTVNTCPSLAFPEMVGVGAVVKVSAVTTAVAALALITVACEVLDPVTSTVILLPTSLAVRVYLSGSSTSSWLWTTTPSLFQT